MTSKEKDYGYGIVVLCNHSGGNPNYSAEAAAIVHRLEKTENETFQHNIVEFVLTLPNRKPFFPQANIYLALLMYFAWKDSWVWEL